MDTKSLLFVADIFTEDSDEFSIIDECVLRKAKDNEINEIEKIVVTICEGINKINPYYNAGLDEYNYWVIENHTENIQSSFTLSKLDTTFFAETISIDGVGFQTKFNQIQIATYFHDNRVRLMNFNSDIHLEIVEISEALRNLQSIEFYKIDFEFLIKAIDDFSELKKITRYSPFKILGIFSIIELLLTHKPDVNKNSDDSINRQIKTKIVLLVNRMKEPINFLDYFNEKSLGLEKLITKLYDYRSSIAHGSTISMGLKLKDNDKSNIYKFLYELTRKLIIQAIKEPHLVKDLKKC